MRMVESRSCVQREGVYRWFSSLTSAQRAEFLCGLLDLCVPIELRFLGSCLEDLARKDYHSLRDAEIKANNPVDLSGLTNITDEVVRSKLLVSLALLGSDNREAAGVLYRTLTHIDTVINNYGLALNDGRTAEQFLLLFTMASHHPAFSFHQKQVLRQQLSHVQDVFQVSSGGGGGEAPAACPAVDRSSVCYTQPHHHYPHQTMSLPLGCSMPEASAAFLPLSACQACHTHCTCWHKNQTREACAVSGQGSIGRPDQALSQELTPHPPELPHPPPPPSPPTPPPRSHLPPPIPAGQDQDAPAPTMNHQGKAGKVVIERVVLRGVTHKSEDGSEYVFEANWSDGLVSSIIRTRQEVTELLSQLSQAFPDRVEKFLPQSVELDARCLTALPCHVLHHHSVQLFFTSALPVSPSSPVSIPPSLHPSPSSLPTAPVAPTCPFNSTSKLGCTVQYRGTNRAVYRVASVQPVVSSHSSVLARPSPLVSSLPPPPLPPPQLSSLPPSMVTGGEAYSQPQLYPQALHLSHAQPTSHSLSQSLSYSPSHSHSRPQSHLQTAAQCQPNTLEQNGILDWLRKLRLHKYYPVFKQLTMEEFLALSEDDLNKYDLTQGAKKKLKTQLELQKSLDREMKMEKRPCSGIARVTPSSHMGPSTHPTSSSTGELRVEVEGAPHHQPVPTDSSSSSGYSSSSCSPRAPPLCGDSTFDRARDMHRRVSGPDAVAVGLEKERPCLFILNSSCSSRPTAQVLPVQTDPGPPPLPLPQSAYHTQACYPQSLLSNPARIMTPPRKPRPPPLCTDDRAKLPVGSGFSTRAAVGLMVETSSALTSTSNSLHHVSHPPLHFHLSSSSSSSPSPSGYYSCPPISSSSTSSSSFSSGSAGGFASMATSSSVPVIAVPGTSYYPAQPSSSPSSSPSAVSPLDQSSAPSMCVCSSCGCRGNCGVYSALPGYAAAGYLQQFSAGASLFTLAPLLLASGPSSYPMMVPPQLYQQGHAFYQAHGMLGNGGQKRAAGYLSCYNCGANGHRAEECKQPAMDSAQQGTFRLKYTPHSDSKDSGD